ncbi:hypothetical protein A3J78_00540 [Candidatus Beckwithbacteria bacterium RBG_13_35_6]|uniref:R3H domain-containing protein n=1 Tax=Candidatus Beckwithbacteria bacterium RBG_13_35_6 TaxID=1797456 RepID=A0A1F5DEQ6_9BACT|nr:MAG: hypothetical protein A3J78_00540 [Candidatus Beckwithbacteria bacterium RBG_13_35_6]
MKTKKPPQNNNLKIIKDITKDLLEHLDIKSTKIAVLEDEAKITQINIDCNENHQAMLIGYRGETISSLQLIISLMAYKQTGEWQKLVVNIGQYRQQREESLKKLALNSAQKVKFSGEEVILPKLNAAERRIIHLTLADSLDVKTESIGEGSERTLVIKPKK